MIATKESVHIRDIVTGNALTRSLGMRDPVCDAVYSQKYDELAVVTSPGAMSFVDVIDAQTGRSSAFYSFHPGLSCIAFSQTTRQLVCGLKIRGAALVDVSGSIWMGPDFPATITTVSTLSNWRSWRSSGPPLPSISHSTRNTDFTSTTTHIAFLTMSSLHCTPLTIWLSVVGGCD